MLSSSPRVIDANIPFISVSRSFICIRVRLNNVMCVILLIIFTHLLDPRIDFRVAGRIRRSSTLGVHLHSHGEALVQQNDNDVSSVLQERGRALDSFASALLSGPAQSFAGNPTMLSLSPRRTMLGCRLGAILRGPATRNPTLQPATLLCV